MQKTKLQELAALIHGAKLATEAGDSIVVDGFLKDVHSLTREILRKEDVAGRQGETRFDELLLQFQSRPLVTPTRTVISNDRVGGEAGNAVESEHAAAIEETKRKHRETMESVGAIGISIVTAFATGNPATALPAVFALGEKLISLLDSEVNE